MRPSNMSKTSWHAEDACELESKLGCCRPRCIGRSLQHHIANLLTPTTATMQALPSSAGSDGLMVSKLHSPPTSQREMLLNRDPLGLRSPHSFGRARSY